MKVVFDITPLGDGHCRERARAGIFHAVENLALQLANTPSIDLTLWSHHRAVQLEQSVRYIEEAALFPRTSFIFSESSDDAAERRAFYEANLRRERELKPEDLAAFRKQQEAQHQPNYFEELLDPDIYHFNWGLMPPTGGRAVRFMTIFDLIPVLFPDFFGDGVKSAHYQHQQRVLASIGERDHIVAISQSTKDDLCSFAGIAPERVHVAHLAAARRFASVTDPDRQAAIRAKYGIPDGPFMLGVNTLEPRKNMGLVLQAIDLLLSEHADFDLNFVLVGPKGWKYEAFLEQMTRNPEVKRRVFMPGYAAGDDLPTLFSAAEMFVYPSFYEGFGLPPLEAMQCGTPVIAADNSSLPEVVGDAGIMIDARDAEALAVAILKLHGNAALRRELRERGLLRARQFSWEKCAAAVIAGYQAALQD